MRPPVCQYDAKDPDIRSHGCTIEGLAYLRREATDGDAWDDPDAEARRMREASGTSLSDFRKRGTTMSEAKTAYEGVPFGGRVKPFLKRFSGGSIRDDLIPGLTGRTWAGVCVNYGVVQDKGRGVGSFRGGHFVVVGDPSGGSITVADSLRRELVTWSVNLLEEAAEKFGDHPWLNGRGEFGIVAYAPTVLELRTQQRDDARAALAAEKRSTAQLTTQARTLAAANKSLSTDLDSARAHIAELEAAPTATERALLDKALLLNVTTPEKLQDLFDRAAAAQQAVADERHRVVDALIAAAEALR